MPAERIAAVVLNWCAYGQSRACVDRLASSDYPDLVTIVVDNASPDGSGEQLKRELPTATHIAAGRNLGYAGGNNLGIARARELGADLVLLLNPDVEVARDCVSALARTLLAEPRAALVAPKVIHAEDGSVGAVGGEVDWLLAEPRQRGHLERDAGQFSGVTEVEFAPGTLVLCRMRAIAEVGPIPDEYFLYFEDVDWSLRFRAAGWRVLADPSAVGVHRESSSVGRESPLKSYYYVRNNLHFIDRWVSESEREATRRRFRRKLGRMMIKGLARGRLRAVRAMLLGYSDYRAGIRGIAPWQRQS
jgi:GT2 family glycosyltransferase